MSNAPYELDSPEAERRRQEPLYKLLQRLDAFLHEVEGEESEALHEEVHEAAFQFVTEQRCDEMEQLRAQWNMALSLGIAVDASGALYNKALVDYQLSQAAPAQVAEPHVPEKEDDLTEAIEWWKQGSTTPEDAFTKNGLRLFVNALIAENAELRAYLAAERERLLKKVVDIINDQALPVGLSAKEFELWKDTLNDCRDEIREALSRTEPEAQNEVVS